MATINFESSQYVDVEFTLANTGQRLLASFIDMVVFIIYFIIIFAFLGDQLLLHQFNYADFFYLLLIKLPWILYNPICEYFMNGQTIGKYMVGIRIVTLNGERPTLKEVFTRWIFKGDFIWISPDILMYLWFAMGIMGAGVISLTKHNQRLADILAGTICIKLKGNDVYRLSDVLAIKDLSTHEVKYPQVTRFTDEDMMMIKNTIIRLRQNPNPETIKFGRELCDETARLIGIEEVQKNRLAFLETVLQDYVVLTR